jgi:hypothetical protein
VLAELGGTILADMTSEQHRKILSRNKHFAARDFGLLDLSMACALLARCILPQKFSERHKRRTAAWAKCLAGDERRL